MEKFKKKVKNSYKFQIVTIIFELNIDLKSFHDFVSLFNTM